MIEVEVACGKLDKENCAVVVPEINSKTVSQNVRLKPLESKGSVESVDGLCEGDVQMAVVQEDVLAKRSAKPDCAGKLVVLGRPLYPYEGFMVVRDETREGKFEDMVRRLCGHRGPRRLVSGLPRDRGQDSPRRGGRSARNRRQGWRKTRVGAGFRAAVSRVQQELRFGRRAHIAGTTTTRVPRSRTVLFNLGYVREAAGPLASQRPRSSHARCVRIGEPSDRPGSGR
jgi:hypothetical protein